MIMLFVYFSLDTIRKGIIVGKITKSSHELNNIKGKKNKVSQCFIVLLWAWTPVVAIKLTQSTLYDGYWWLI